MPEKTKSASKAERVKKAAKGPREKKQAAQFSPSAMAEHAISLEPVKRLSKDLRQATTTLSRSEARYLVDSYYQMQGNRIRAQNQIRSLSTSGEPHEVLVWLGTQADVLEREIKKALESYALSRPAGEWAMSNTGVGPVISAGLLAHIDVEKAPYPSNVWSYAGMNPNKKWEKGQMRPWNARLKIICWHASECFVRFKGLEGCFYGRLYDQRRAQEDERNAAGMFAPQAANILATRNMKKDTVAYSHYIEGRLPPAHLKARAQRWVSKIFLAHYHAVLTMTELNRIPPRPYPVVHLGEAHNRIIPIPNTEGFPNVEKFLEEYYKDKVLIMPPPRVSTRTEAEEEE